MDTEVIGKYELREEIGRGTFGVVYKAYDADLDWTVAIKVLQTERLESLEGTAARQSIERFIAEGRHIAKLSQDKLKSIANVIEAGRDASGHYYIVSQFIEGSNLADWLRSHHATPRQAAQVIAELADALAAVHENDVVHRDVKPGNIILEEGMKPVLIDFGLASRTEDLVDVDCFEGSPPYHSPEQASHTPKLDGRSDIYSLGSVFYELLTGEQPFFDSDVMKRKRTGDADGPIIAAARKMHEETEALVPIGTFDVPIRVPKRLVAICDKAMQLDPESRYQTAREMAHDLNEYLQKPSAARRLVWGGSVIAGLTLVTLSVAAVVAQFGEQQSGWRGRPRVEARNGLIPLKQLANFWIVKRPIITNETVLEVKPKLLPPNVTLDNDTMRLVNRGYAISQKVYPDGAFIEFEWKWKYGDGTYSDHLTVVFRTSGEHREKWPHEGMTGVAVKFMPYAHSISFWHLTGDARVEERLGDYDKVRISRDYWHTIRIEDNGQTLSVFFNDLSHPAITVDLPNDLQHHRIAIYNREAVGGQNKESLLINMAMGMLHEQ